MKKILLCITGITLHFIIIKIENFLFIKLYFTILLFFFFVFFQINSALMSRRFISESLIVMFPNFWQVL